MPSYLSPARFKKMGFGIDVSELDDDALAALSAQATVWVNAYCLVPRLPQMHDFRGGTVVGEQHSWRYPETPFDVGQRKAYPFHWPIKRISQFRIYVTNTQYVNIAPTELFLNNSLRYMEVVSLAITSSGLYNALIIPNIGLATPVVRLGYDYGWDLYESGEMLQPYDGQTWGAQNQWWYSDYEANDVYGEKVGGPPVITVNGSVVTTGFTVNYDEGTVVFDVEPAAGTIVQAAYHYKLPGDIQYAAGHIMAWLHTEAEQHSRGMAHLDSLEIGEVKMKRPRVFAPSEKNPPDLETLIPEAAALLYTYRFDGVSVR